jgi:hypothetical protein
LDQFLDCIAQSLNIANVDGLVTLLRFRNDAKRHRDFLDDHLPLLQPVGSSALVLTIRGLGAFESGAIAISS